MYKKSLDQNMTMLCRSAADCGRSAFFISIQAIPEHKSEPHSGLISNMYILCKQTLKILSAKTIFLLVLHKEIEILPIHLTLYLVS